MKHEELMENVKEMFGTDPEVCQIRDILEAMEEAGVKPLPTYKEMLKACEALIDAGVLQSAGREGFEATLDYMVECDHDVTGLAK